MDVLLYAASDTILWYFQLTLPLTLIAVLVVTSTLADPIKVIENSPVIGLHSDQEEGSVVYRDQIIG